MRSYKQKCGLAKALDIVGDRWTLLIIRELLIRGGCRYTDLQNGLPGIATNLLAERLRDLEANGIISRTEMPPPIATSLFELTQRGRELESAMVHLGAWGAPLIAQAGAGETLQPHWLILPLRHVLADNNPQDQDAIIELRAGAETIFIKASCGAVEVQLGQAGNPDAAAGGPADLLLKLLTGRVSLAQARQAGLVWQGPPELLDRVIARR